jgi:predicted RNase H-like nuclease (RuvC/YqgF family)
MPKTVELPKEAALPTDPLADSIAAAQRGVHELRTDNEWLREEVQRLERANLQLESECNTLKITLESEKAERRHYHSLANEIITRLDIVGQTVHDVVKRAEQEVYRQRKEHPRAEPAALPEDLPETLAAFLNGSTKPATQQMEAA